MTNFQRSATLPVPKRERQMVCYLAWRLFTCLIMLCFLSISGASASTNPNGRDSTSVERTQRDLVDLKEHVPLSKVQEESVYVLFLSKYQYLERAGAAGSRWELVRQTKMRKLRELLGAESYLLLDNAGLLKQWFGEDQDQPITYE